MQEYMPKYLTDEFREMPKGEMDEKVVRWGEISPKKVFEAILGREAEADELKSSLPRIKKAIAGLSRCEHDLLRLEFGTNEAKLGEVLLSSNALEDYPMSANLRLIREALNVIEEALKPRKTPA